MDFESRQKAWTGGPREFRQHNGRNERPTVWKIKVEGNRVYSEHGLLDGAIQSTSYVGEAKNIGKANAITAEQDALAEARRDCRKKSSFGGYSEYINGIDVDNRDINISVSDLLSDLPESFCLYKPGNNLLKEKFLLEKAEANKVWYPTKRNGMAFNIVITPGNEVNIYSRTSRRSHDKEGAKELADGTLDYSTVIPWNRRFPYIVEEVKKLGLPPYTMLAGEIVSTPDNFKYVAEIVRSLTPEALSRQTLTGWLQFYCWDIPFYNNKNLLLDIPVKDRYSLISSLILPKSNRESLLPIEVHYFKNIKESLDYARDNKLEGWVVVDPEGIYGNKGYSLRGKPDRPAKACSKLKPDEESDFIVMWDPAKGIGEWGAGKHEPGKLVELPSGEKVVHGGVGSVGLHQYNTKGELIYISKCSGMDYEFQAKLTKDSFPMVWEVTYAERRYISDGDKTNAVSFPRLHRVRTDKLASECVDENL